MQVSSYTRLFFFLLSTLLCGVFYAHAEDSTVLQFIGPDGTSQSQEVSAEEPILFLVDDTSGVAIKEASKAYDRILNKRGEAKSQISLVNQEGHSTRISFQKNVASAVKTFSRLSKRIDLRTTKRFVSKAQLKLGVNARLSRIAPPVTGLRDLGTLSKVNRTKELGSVSLRSRGNSFAVTLIPNGIVRAQGDPNDPRFSEQWGLVKLRWGVPLPSNPNVIGVVGDTGARLDHEDLKDVLWKNPDEIPGNSIDDDGNGYLDDVYGWNFARRTNSPFDAHGHGTHVSGIFGAKTDNRIGIAGVTSVPLMQVAVLDENGSGRFDTVLEGLRYSLVTIAKQKGKFAVVNMSLGGVISDGAVLAELVREVENIYQASEGHGMLVAAAGNSHENNDVTPFFPARAAHIAVAATQGDDRLAGFSNEGRNTVHVAAPGLGILSSILNGEYGVMSGTSMAAPAVSGVLAAMKAQKPSASIEELKRVLMETCRTPSFGSLPVACGGVVDYDAALRAFGGGGVGERTPTATPTGTLTATPTPYDPTDPTSGMPPVQPPYPNPRFEAEILNAVERPINVGEEFNLRCQYRDEPSQPWGSCREPQLMVWGWLGRYNGWQVYGRLTERVLNGKFKLDRLKFPETPWEGRIIRQYKCGGPAWLIIEYRGSFGIRKSFPQKFLAGTGSWGCENGPRPTRVPTKTNTPSGTPTRVRGTPTATPTSTPTNTPTVPPTPTPTVPISNMRVVRINPPMGESGVRVTSVTGRCFISSHTGAGLPCPRVEMHARNVVTRDVTFVGGYSGRNVIDYEFNFTGLPSGRYETLFYGFNERGERQQNIGASVIVGSGEQATPTATPTRSSGATPTFTATPRSPTATPTSTPRSTNTPTVTPSQTPTATPTQGSSSCPVPRILYQPAQNLSIGVGHTIRLDVLTDYEAAPGDDYYTWRRNGQDLTSTTPKILRTENVAGNVQYSVKITRRCPGGATSEAISNAINLEVRPTSACDSPRIISQPANQTVNQGEYALFSVQANRGLTYQWVSRSPSGQESNVPYSDLPFIFVRGDAGRSGYQYFVRISDGRCAGYTVQSATATLNVRQ